MSWRVTVVDESPYPKDLAGYRQRDAVARQARAIARAHGGYMTFEIFRPADRDPPALRQAGLPVLHVRPGSRPPVPAIHAVPPPPAGQLSLSPDSPADAPVRPDQIGLDAVPWQDLDTACVPAADLPALIVGWAQGRPVHVGGFGELFSYLVHQGTCYSATAPALEVLARRAACGAVPAAKRRDIYRGLLWAAGRYDDDLVADADLAAAHGRPPQPGQWARQVRDVVGAVTPGLLARWADEPSACRLVLAALAAAFPGHGQAVAEEVDAIAKEFTGTQAGAYTRLAHHLISKNTERALAVTAEIAAWNDRISTDVADDESVAPAVRALDLLTQAVA